MAGYIIDFVTVSVLVIGITAVMGSILNTIGVKVFGGRKKSEFVDQNQKIQTGWHAVGGKNNKKKPK